MVTIGIGQRAVGRAPGRLAIYGLGSCVAIFLLDGESRVGGMAHALLPDEPPPEPAHRHGRYVPAAVRVLIAELQANGARRRRLRAKLVGGASVLRGFQSERSEEHTSEL